MADLTRSLPLSAPTFWTFIISVVLAAFAIIDRAAGLGLPIGSFGLLVIGYVVLLVGVLFNRL